jgi:hypothetical protein
MICSISRIGNCWDIAPTIKWLNSFKNERMYGKRYYTRIEVLDMSFENIEFFNTLKDSVQLSVMFNHTTSWTAEWVSNQRKNW